MQQPAIKCYYELAIDGKQVGRRRLSRSFVAALTKMLYGQMSQSAVGYTIADTGGTARTYVTTRANPFAMAAASGTSTNGIVVGTGSTAVTPADNKLVTQIATGSSSGQLAYQIQIFQTLTSDSTTNSFQLQRVFINNSGSTITVNEIGIYATLDVVSAWWACLVRDVIGGGQAVLAGQSLTVTYTFSAAI